MKNGLLSEEGRKNGVRGETLNMNRTGRAGLNRYGDVLNASDVMGSNPFEVEHVDRYYVYERRLNQKVSYADWKLAYALSY